VKKTPTEPEKAFRHDPRRVVPPQSVKLPDQVRLAPALAEDLIAGKRPRPVPKPKTKVPYADAQIDRVLQRWDCGELRPNDQDLAQQ
jgi:hypothetical protein